LRSGFGKNEVPSYFLNETKSTVIGNPFLVDQKGTIEKRKVWVGLFNSPDGWEIKDVVKSDFVRKELIYSGKSGNVIDVSYKEFRGNMAAPAFYQNLKYDMSESRIIRFQNFTIEIVSANNQKITYKVVSDK
jgi:hypothetical protein